MAPTELVTAAQEGLPVTVVIPENHGYQVIHRLQMLRSGRELATSSATATAACPHRRSSRGGSRRASTVSTSRSTWCRSHGALAHARCAPLLPPKCVTRSADTRDHDGPVVIVIPAIPHADLPPGVWWDVAPAEVSDEENVAQLRRVRNGTDDATVVRMTSTTTAGRR